MVGDAPLLLVADQPLPLLRAGDQPLDAFLELGQPDVRLAPTGCQKRCLVDKVGQVCPHETRRHGRDLPQADGPIERNRAGMDLEDLLAADQVRAIHNDVTVEAAGPHERRIKRLRAIGRGQEDGPRIRVEAVHLHQELVQCLIALVVSSRPSRAAGLADGVQLVDEDETGGLGPGLGEEVAHPRMRPRPRTARRNQSLRGRRMARPPHRPPRGPAASCRFPGRRSAGPPWESVHPEC